MFMEHADSTMGQISPEGSLDVRTVTLDRLVSDGTVPIPQYLKIDVEGSEVAVLSGARQLLASTHPVIFLSTHGHDLHRKCCDILTSLGYSLRAIGEKDVTESDELLAVY
jgi:hypothetical protein